MYTYSTILYDTRIKSPPVAGVCASVCAVRVTAFTQAAAAIGPRDLGREIVELSICRVVFVLHGSS